MISSPVSFMMLEVEALFDKTVPSFVLSWFLSSNKAFLSIAFDFSIFLSSFLLGF